MKKALSWALSILLFSLAILTLVVFVVGLILEEEEVLETILFTSAAITLFVILALFGCWNLPRTNNEQEKAKKLKAYEIIKRKRVDVGILVVSANVQTYNFHFRLVHKWQLTKEEFDLLKEVLK